MGRTRPSGKAFKHPILAGGSPVACERTAEEADVPDPCALKEASEQGENGHDPLSYCAGNRSSSAMAAS
jgi:hypothetical protein